jgi:hypothetical protein
MIPTLSQDEIRSIAMAGQLNTPTLEETITGVIEVGDLYLEAGDYSLYRHEKVVLEIYNGYYISSFLGNIECDLIGDPLLYLMAKKGTQKCEEHKSNPHITGTWWDRNITNKNAWNGIYYRRHKIDTDPYYQDPEMIAWKMRGRKQNGQESAGHYEPGGIKW